MPSIHIELGSEGSREHIARFCADFHALLGECQSPLPSALAVGTWQQWCACVCVQWSMYVSESGAAVRISHRMGGWAELSSHALARKTKVKGGGGG